MGHAFSRNRYFKIRDADKDEVIANHTTQNKHGRPRFYAVHFRKVSWKPALPRKVSWKPALPTIYEGV